MDIISSHFLCGYYFDILQAYIEDKNWTYISVTQQV